MGKNEKDLPRWAKVPLFLIFAGIIIWAIVPGKVLYISLGIALAVIGGVSYLIYRKWGTQPFKTLAKGTYKWLTESRKPESPSRLSSHEADLLKVAVGNRCEMCGKHDNLEVHHIIPRSEEGSSHKLENLLVLCRDHHWKAENGDPSRYRQQLSAKNRNYYKFDLVKDWKHR